MLGKFEKKDIKKAIELYTKSANQNYAMAQYNLSVLYLDGIHVPKNKKKRFRIS